MYTKRKLSPEQLRQYLTCAREMEAEGNRMQIHQEWMKPSPVEIMRSDRSGQVCNNYGLFSYVIPVKVVAYSRVQICDYEVYSGLEDIEIYFP